MEKLSFSKHHNHFSYYYSLSIREISLLFLQISVKITAIKLIMMICYKKMYIANGLYNTIFDYVPAASAHTAVRSD